MTENSTSTAVARRDEGPGGLITKYRDDFAMVLPAHVKPDHWVRLSQGLLRRDEKLRQVATRNPGSFLAALLDCARLGLEPGDTYHLVPFGNEIQGIPDWTGLVELIYRAGAVSSVKAECVYANDTFRYVPGEMDRPVHEPDWFGDRGEFLGAYAYAVMNDGGTSQVVLYSRAQIEEVRSVSRSSRLPSSPWTKWYDRMALKTVVRRLSKLVPSSAEYRETVLRSEAALESVSEPLRITLPPQGVAQEDFDPNVDEGPEPDLVDDDDVVDAVIVDDDDGAEAPRPRPVPSDPADDPDGGITEGQAKALAAIFRAGKVLGPARFDEIERAIGVRVTSLDQLTSDQAGDAIAALQDDAPTGDAA